MHDHGGAAAAAGLLDLMPLGVEVFWLLVLAAVTAVHAVHMIRMPGAPAAWHATHVLVGAGMLGMIAPGGGLPVDPRVWLSAFAAAAVVVAGWAAWQVQRGTAVNTLWVASAVGLAAMGYMFATHLGAGSSVVTYVLIAYFVAEAAAWSRGWLVEHGTRRAGPIPHGIGSGQPDGPLAGKARYGVVGSHIAMNMAMAYMLVAMNTGARAFFDQAFTSGQVTEQTMWAGALIALALAACVPVPATRHASASPAIM